MRYTYSQCRQGYIDNWNRMKLTRRKVVEAQARAIIANKARYVRLENLTSVKWFVIGAIHIRESGLRNGQPVWDACLHNGQRIIGTGRKTTLVPKGRGPFATFEDAAVDAIKGEGLDKLDWSDEQESIAITGWVFEKFNGFGYRMRNLPSPYLWGGTNIQQRGKFVADGKFSRNTWDVQIGGMALIKAVMELDPSARFKTVEPETEESQEPIPLPKPRPSDKIDQKTTVAVGGGWAAIIAWYYDNAYWLVPVAIVSTIAIAIAIVWWRDRNNTPKSPKTFSRLEDDNDADVNYQ